MITLAEYNQQKCNVEEFERTVALAVIHMKIHMKGVQPCGWNVDDDAKVSSSDDTVTVNVPNLRLCVPWSDLQKYMEKGKWVVELCDRYVGNKEYHIFDSEKAATEDYKKCRARTLGYSTDGNYDLDWVREPRVFSWPEIASIDRGERYMLS